MDQPVQLTIPIKSVFWFPPRFFHINELFLLQFKDIVKDIADGSRLQLVFNNLKFVGIGKTGILIFRTNWSPQPSTNTSSVRFNKAYKFRLRQFLIKCIFFVAILKSSIFQTKYVRTFFLFYMKEEISFT